MHCSVFPLFVKRCTAKTGISGALFVLVSLAQEGYNSYLSTVLQPTGFLNGKEEAHLIFLRKKKKKCNYLK